MLILWTGVGEASPRYPLLDFGSEALVLPAGLSVLCLAQGVLLQGQLDLKNPHRPYAGILHMQGENSTLHKKILDGSFTRFKTFSMVHWQILEQLLHKFIINPPSLVLHETGGNLQLSECSLKLSRLKS